MHVCMYFLGNSFQQAVMDGHGEGRMVHVVADKMGLY